MANPPIHWITARVYCHATEDEDLVRRALDNIVPAASEERQVLEGQFGGPLIVLTRRVSASPEVAETWNRWAAAGLIDRIRESVDQRLDSEGVLHVRLDKQAAFGGVLALATGTDVVDVQAKLKAFPARQDILRRVAREVVGAT
jgi:RNA-binding protein